MRMNSFLDIFRKKSRTLNEVSADAPIAKVPESQRAGIADVLRNLTLFNITGSCSYNGVDGITAYNNFAEVFFPIHFIASRIAGAHYEIKRTKDDSVVWCTTRSRATDTLQRLLTQPNSLQTWSQFVYAHFISKLGDGNAFMYAPISDVFAHSQEKYKWIDQLWTIPANMMSIETVTSYKLRVFSVYKLDEVIRGYRIAGSNDIIKPGLVWHDRDLFSNYGQITSKAALMSPSRLDSVRRNISTLGKVYDARNTIYANCGALGMIINKTKDDTGPFAMTDEEKEALHRNYNSGHGVTDGKSPIMISNLDLDYKQIGQGIAHLQPFEETLADAVAIAGVYEIPSVLIPRKDQSTFDNQANAEKAVYSNVIKRLGQQFCKEFTEFLGLKDYYIDINFDDVDCLQVGRKEAEEVLTMVNATARQMFIDGLITYNDWRGRVHEAALDGDVYGKVRMEMTDEEIQFFNTRLNNIFGITTNPQQENGKDHQSANADEDN